MVLYAEVVALRAAFPYFFRDKNGSQLGPMFPLPFDKAFCGPEEERARETGLAKIPVQSPRIFR
jgi:hypothetical protein